MRKLDSHTVEIVTKNPFPILPDVISLVYIMSQKWCEENRAEKPVDKRKGVENTASFKANGTGPFRLRSRDPGVRTVLVRNLNYWDKVETNVDEVIFTPIGADATRVAALLSGEIDMMEPVPVQDVTRLRQNPNLTVMQGPELRTIFLGMDQARDELLFSNVKGKNPFKDVRVRQRVLSGDRHRSDQDPHHARRGDADRADDRAGHQGLLGRPEQAPAVRSRSREEAAGRGRLSERLRARR